MMTTKIILTLTLITFLIQNSLTNPLPRADPWPEEQNAVLDKILNHLKNGGDKEELTPKEQLLLFSFKEFEKLADYFEESSAQVIDSTLKDEEIANGVTEDIVEFKNQLQNYLVLIQKNVKTFPQRLGIMEAFSKVVTEYDLDDTEATTATDKQKFFARILDKHGLGQLNQDFGVKFLSTLHRIFDETKKHMNDLKEEETIRIQKFIELMNSIGTKKTNDDKLKYIFDFIDKDHDDDDGSKEKKNGEN